MFTQKKRLLLLITALLLCYFLASTLLLPIINFSKQNSHETDTVVIQNLQDLKLLVAKYKYKKNVVFHKIKNLNSNHIKLLKQIHIKNLYLNSVTTIEDTLQQNIENIYLNKLEDISNLKYLSKWQGNILSLNSVKTIDQKFDIAKLKNKTLYLNNLQKLQEPTIKSFYKWAYDPYIDKMKILCLNGIRKLDESTCHKMARWSGNCISLDGLKKVNFTTFKTFFTFKCPNISLNGLQKIPQFQNSEAPHWHGKSLSLNGIKKLDSNVEKWLSQWEIIPKEKIDTRDFIENFSLQKQGFIQNIDLHLLFLNGITKVTPDEIQLLSSWKGDGLILNGLQNITPEIITELRKLDISGISLNAITDLPNETIKALAKTYWEIISLGGFHKMDYELADSLTQLAYRCLVLNGLQSLDNKMAQVLVARGRYSSNRHLVLNGLKNIDYDTAKTLSETHRYNWIYLEGLNYIDDKTKKLLLENSKKFIVSKGLLTSKRK